MRVGGEKLGEAMAVGRREEVENGGEVMRDEGGMKDGVREESMGEETGDEEVDLGVGMMVMMEDGIGTQGQGHEHHEEER